MAGAKGAEADAAEAEHAGVAKATEARLIRNEQKASRRRERSDAGSGLGDGSGKKCKTDPSLILAAAAAAFERCKANPGDYQGIVEYYRLAGITAWRALSSQGCSESS